MLLGTRRRGRRSWTHGGDGAGAVPGGPPIRRTYRAVTLADRGPDAASEQVLAGRSAVPAGGAGHRSTVTCSTQSLEARTSAGPATTMALTWGSMQPPSHPGGTRMEIAYTEEQQALRSELRDVLPQAAHPRGRGGAGRRPRHRARRAPGGQADGQPTAGSASAGRPSAGGQGARPSSSSSSSTSRCAAGRRCPCSPSTRSGPTIMNFGTAGAEGLLPAQDPGRRDPLLHRLHRAGVGHRPGLAADPGRARRRRVRHQRRRRSSPAWPATPTTSGWPPAPIPRRPSTRASPCSSSPWTPRASRWSPCTCWATTTSTTRSTRTCGCRPPTWSGARTRAGP